MSMPDEIELTNSEDFYRVSYHNHRGQRCFVGWQRKLLPDLDLDEIKRFRAIAKNEARKLRLHTKIIGGGLTRINDNTDNSKEQLANWFAQTIRVFGYDIS